MTITDAFIRDPGHSKSSNQVLNDDRPRVTPATLRGVRLVVLPFVLAISVLQLALLLDTANFAVSALTVVGNVLGYGYALRQSLLRRYPISSLMLLGYTFSYFSLPPLGQLLDLHTTTHHLYYPVFDLGYAIIGLLALIGGHLLCSKVPLFATLRGMLRKWFYGPLGFYLVPRLSQLWLMGAVGCVAILAADGGTAQASGIYQAVLHGLRPFVYVPYVSLLLPAWSPTPYGRIPRLNNLGLVLYTGLLLVLAMIVNSRAYLLMGFASLLIVYFYLLATARMPLPRMRAHTVIFACLATLVIMGPVSELAMTMVLVRGERADLTPSQLVVQTWKIFRSGHVAERYERLASAMSGGRGVNETYFDNLFLNRLANLKLIDNAVINQKALSIGGGRYFTHIEEQKVMSVLPSPLLNVLSINPDKSLVTSGSSGDFLLYAATGNPYAIGGFRTGSLLVNLAVVFGYLWPLALMLSSALIFAIVDSWCWMGKDDKTKKRTVRFNPLVVGMVFTETFFFTSAATATESISGIMGVLLRGWVQIAVLYAFVFWVSRMLTSWIRS